MIRIVGGTPRSDRPSLCDTCSYYTKMRSERDQTLAQCSRLDIPIRSKIVECTSYDQRDPTPLVYKTAWILGTDNRGKLKFRKPGY